MNIIKHSAIILLALLCGACARNHLAEINDKPAEREVDVRIDFRAPEAPKTNVGRPLESVDPLQKVTDVSLYFFRSEKKEGPYVYCLNLPVSDFQNYTSAQGDETHTYQIKPTLTEGFYYRILAVGLSEDTAEGRTDRTQIDWTEGVTEWGEALAWNVAEEKTGRVAESFSGIATDMKTAEETFFVSKTNETIGFNAEVELHRAVAGVMLYVTNVPAEVEGTALSRIAVLTADFNTSLNPFTRHITQDLQGEQSVIAEIEVMNPQPTATFITGNFIYPSRTYKEDLNGPSLLLAFYAENALEPFKTIPLKSVRAEELESSEDSTDSEISMDGLQFNLLANHIYCLGLKSKDQDEPFDLGKHLENPDVKIFIMGCYQADVDVPM